VCTLVYIEDVELQTPPSEHICRGGGGWRRCLGWQRWPALAEICRLLRRSPKVRISNAMTVRYIALVNASEQLYCLSASAVQLPPTPPPRNISGTDASFAVAHGTNTVRRLRAIWARCRTYRPHSDSGLGRQGRKGGTNKRDVGRTDETKDSPRLGDLGVREGCPKRRLHAGCRPRGGEAVRGQPEWGV
jgi:hypothetical protein